MGLFGDKDKNNIRDGKSTRELGMISQTAILYALARNGEEVLIPWADYLRYDIAIFKNGGLIRIQVKTARLSPDGAFITFSAFSTNWRGGKGTAQYKKGYKGEVEYFGVYCPELDKVYLVPVDVVPENNARLRISTKNFDNYPHIVWAYKYEI
jgi:hypothetical protein